MNNLNQNTFRKRDEMENYIDLSELINSEDRYVKMDISHICTDEINISNSINHSSIELNHNISFDSSFDFRITNNQSK